MAPNENCIFTNNYVIPIYGRSGYLEDKNLSITVCDFGDKLQVKLKDPSEYSFNYTECIDLGDFEIIRHNQTLDINYSEFKTNIIDMLHQFQKKEMLLKCQISEKSCSLVFFTKSKIKSIIYLVLELRMTDQKEVIAEMSTEMQELQDINNRLQRQLAASKKSVLEKGQEIEELKSSERNILAQFCKNCQQIEGLVVSKLKQIESQVFSKTESCKSQLLGLQNKINILKQENNLKCNSTERLIQTMEDLRLENSDRSKEIEDLKTQNASLNNIRAALEKNMANQKNVLEDVQNVNSHLEKKKIELEKDLEKLSIALTQKESKISELTKDLIQANNMLVQFNNRYDSTFQQLNEFQEALITKEKLLVEQKCHTNQILRSYEEYKMNFNSEKMENMRRDLLEANRRIHELEAEVRKQNKLNTLLSQKLSQV